MKKLLLLSFFLISAFTKAQSTIDSLPEVNGKVVYQVIVNQAGKTQLDLFNAAKKSLFDFYKNPQSVALTEDKDQGQILC